VTAGPAATRARTRRKAESGNAPNSSWSSAWADGDWAGAPDPYKGRAALESHTAPGPGRSAQQRPGPSSRRAEAAINSLRRRLDLRDRRQVHRERPTPDCAPPRRHPGPLWHDPLPTALGRLTGLPYTNRLHPARARTEPRPRRERCNQPADRHPPPAGSEAASSSEPGRRTPSPPPIHRSTFSRHRSTTVQQRSEPGSASDYWMIGPSIGTFLSRPCLTRGRT
jgi:hypothetical protein